MRPRISNSGPELTFADVMSTLAPWGVENNERSVANEDYTITAGIGVFETLVQIAVLTPTTAPPTGYEWALRAEFTGSIQIEVDTGTTAVVRNTLQVYTGVGTDWDGLSPTASGTTHSEYDGDAVPSVGEREVIALHATCPLSQLPDPDLPVQSVRLLWQMLADGPTGSARYESQSENETGGWDFTVMWVLQPTS